MKTHSGKFTDKANNETEFERKAKGVILYDDSAILPAAQRFLTRVESDGGQGTEWMFNSWRFDMLRLGHRLEAYRAMQESMDADVVVVAIHNPASWAGLPVGWLGLWWDFRRPKSARLIIASFDQVGEQGFTRQISDPHQMAEARVLPLPSPVLCGIAPDEDTEGNSRTKPPVTEVADL